MKFPLDIAKVPLDNVTIPVFAKFPLRFIIPVPPVSVPLLNKAPVIVSVNPVIFKVAPELIVRFTILAAAPKATLFAPVVAITASSPTAGAIPPTQVAPDDQTPPAGVLVIVEAFAREKQERAAKTKITLN